MIYHFFEMNQVCLLRRVSKVSKPISLYKETIDTSFFVKVASLAASIWIFLR